MRSLLGSDFFHFHAVFGKKFAKYLTLGVGAPPRKIQDPPLKTLPLVVSDQGKYCRGRNSSEEEHETILKANFPENCIRMKEIEPREQWNTSKNVSVDPKLSCSFHY